MSILKLPKDILSLLVVKYIDPKTAGNCLYLCKQIYHYLYDYRIDLIYNMKIAIKCYHSNNSKKSFQCSECNNIVRKKKFKEHVKKHIGKDVKRIKHINCDKCWTPMFPITKNQHLCPLGITTCYEEKRRRFGNLSEMNLVDTNPTCEYKGVLIKVTNHIYNICIKTKCVNCDNLIIISCYNKKCLDCQRCTNIR
jgi:hypothetical protein